MQHCTILNGWVLCMFGALVPLCMLRSLEVGARRRFREQRRWRQQQQGQQQRAEHALQGVNASSSAQQPAALAEALAECGPPAWAMLLVASHLLLFVLCTVSAGRCTKSPSQYCSG